MPRDSTDQHFAYCGGHHSFSCCRRPIPSPAGTRLAVPSRDVRQRIKHPQDGCNVVYHKRAAVDQRNPARCPSLRVACSAASATEPAAARRRHRILCRCLFPSGRQHPPPRRKRAPASPAEASLWRWQLGAFRPTQKRPTGPTPAAPPQDPSLSPASGRIRRSAESARQPARNSATLAAALHFQANTRTPDPGSGSCVSVSRPASGSAWRAWSGVCPSF